jgi:NAD(P)-dependent dehydrogenase (short-subunit alcohol dehydrogenase family)
MTRPDAHVAVITGAARGQGRSHAVALATAGADIIAVDRCADIESIPYPLATEDDMAETAKLVRETGGRIHTVVADVRNLGELQAGIDAGIRGLR